MDCRQTALQDRRGYPSHFGQQEQREATQIRENSIIGNLHRNEAGLDQRWPQIRFHPVAVVKVVADRSSRDLDGHLRHLTRGGPIVIAHNDLIGARLVRRDVV
jgi:hypothetical protein